MPFSSSLYCEGIHNLAPGPKREIEGDVILWTSPSSLQSARVEIRENVAQLPTIVMDKYSLIRRERISRSMRNRQMSEASELTTTTQCSTASSPSRNRKHLFRSFSTDYERNAVEWNLNCISIESDQEETTIYSGNKRKSRPQNLLSWQPEDSRLAVSDSCLFSKTSKYVKCW